MTLLGNLNSVTISDLSQYPNLFSDHHNHKRFSPLSKLAVAPAPPAVAATADALGGTANRRSKDDSRLWPPGPPSSGTSSRVDPSPSSRYGSLRIILGHDSLEAANSISQQDIMLGHKFYISQLMLKNVVQKVA